MLFLVEYASNNSNEEGDEEYNSIRAEFVTPTSVVCILTTISRLSLLAEFFWLMMTFYILLWAFFLSTLSLSLYIPFKWNNKKQEKDIILVTNAT